MSTRGQGHSITFDLGLSHSMTNSNISSKATGQNVTEALQGLWERKLLQMVQATWPPCSYMKKKIENLFLRNQWTDDFKTDQDCSQKDFELTMTYFYGKVKYGKCFNVRFHLKFRRVLPKHFPMMTLGVELDI